VLVSVSIFLSLGVYAFFSCIAGVASLLLPLETKGKDLMESFEQHQHEATHHETKQRGKYSSLADNK
jgi:hypothetical protein